MIFNNKNYSREEIQKYCGNLNQVGGISSYTLSEGYANNTRISEFDTGSGLRFKVVPDRGLDISQASYKGINLTYNGPNGEVNPAFYNCIGNEWQRSFFGGMLTTCGLKYFGHPDVDLGESLGLHGRYSSTPAKNIAASSKWKCNEYILEIEGQIEDSVLFENKLRLSRTISARAGHNSFSVSDIAENYGDSPSPLVVLYHINLGFPFLSENTELVFCKKNVVPYGEYDENVGASISAPTAHYKEKAYLCDLPEDADGFSYVCVVNKSLLDGICLYIKFRKEHLPSFMVWKMLGISDYVVGLEPSNVRCAGRSTLRKEGVLPFINPGECRAFGIEIGVIEGEAKIKNFIEKNIT